MLKVQKSNGNLVNFSVDKITETIQRLSDDLEVDQNLLFQEVNRNLYGGMRTKEIDDALILAAAAYVELEPAYNYFVARIFLQKLKKEVFGFSTKVNSDEANSSYRQSFIDSINIGVEKDILDKRLLDFDLKLLSTHLDLTRDNLFKYLGIRTLYERYFTKIDKKCLELPQSFWMRVAMGLAMNEPERVIEFYDVMSNLLYVPSTPTLFHSGLVSPQLSSCYLTTIDDDLNYIFKSFGDNAQLAKWSGGIGNDWSNVRSTGAFISTTKVESQGAVPFLKIANDTTVAINRSGKRRGATCAYMEIFHLDVEDFIDLRKNTGDERRRTHDMNTAVWVPDLFMKRVRNREDWTLFSPDETPDLHSLYGKNFEKTYFSYEEEAKQGKIKKFKVVSAWKLWKKILTSLFETGHPWVTWKDPSNLRSPQDHVGTVNNSNLCTEILLNTLATKYKRYPDIIKKLGEIAVCNIGSLNLVRHAINGKLNWQKLKSTIISAMRILDNVIDLNFYPVPEARHANLMHRPVGLGIMGLQDLFYLLDIHFEEAEGFVDELQEYISYQAILSSAKLAQERGAYSTFPGSKWDRGIFPLDTLDILEKERGEKIKVNRRSREDWGWLKEFVKKHGMRNSNTMAIAPTATISNIAGCFPCIEAAFKNIYVKANMSGEFTVVNEYLIADLKKLGLWDGDMLDKVKYYEGSIQRITEIPEHLRVKYKEAFEISPFKAIDLTAVRSKWIDMSQSHNIFFKGLSGNSLSDIYMYAWEKGLKTTYYLRTFGASQIEKATLGSKFGLTQKRNVCKIDDPNCETCQ